MKSRIKTLRKHYFLTQNELARKIGKSAGYISLLEADKICLTEEIAKEICHVTGCNYEWLMHGKGKISNIPFVDKEGISTRLKQVRNQQGLSQRSLAKLLNCPPSTINTFEMNRSKPSKAWLKRFSEIMNVNYGWLLTGVEGDFQEEDTRIEEIMDWLKEDPERIAQVYQFLKNDTDEK